MIKRVWIYTGGSLGDWAVDLPRDGEHLIGADRGAAFLLHHGKVPDLILGDFDSITDEERTTLLSSGIPVEEFDPIMKNYSDTELAFHRATLLNPDEIVIVGALGTRFDHSLANVHLLRKALELGIPCRIIGEYNEIQLIDHRLEVTNPDRRYSYISLLPLTLTVAGVTLEGFQYPLQDATLEMGQSLAVSNVLQQPVGLVTISSGLLLVVKSRD